MKKNVLSLFALFLFSLSFAFAQQTEERKLSGYDKIQVGGAFDVYLTKGGEGLKIELEKGDMDNIITEVNGGALIIKKAKNKSRVKAKIYVNFENLKSIHSSGASDIIAKSTIEANDLEIRVSGAGDIKADVKCSGKLDIKSSGAADLELSGSADDMYVSVSGASDIKAGDLSVKTCEIKISGSGDAIVNVSDDLNARVSGSGDIRYKGNPAKQSVKVSGSGSIKKI